MSGHMIAVGEDSHAHLAYQALRRLGAWQRTVDWFGVLLNLAVLLGDADHLRGPCQVLKVSASGVEDLSDKVFRATFS
jgi:hypothetical protein